LTRGLFISFEGIDGSGKTTQVEKLSERLQKETFRVLTLRDPGGSEISEQIRNILLHTSNARMSSLAELLLYEAARAQIVDEKIRPGLASHDVVIIDRYADSTTAYQGYGRGIDLDVVRQSNAIATGGLEPDLTFFIDIPWEAARSRSEHKTQDRLESESEAFFNSVRNGYLAIARDQPTRFHVIDGSQSVESVAQAIYKETAKRTSSWLLQQLQ